MDMCSGGSSKTDYDYIYIQAPYDEALKIFEERFDHDPMNTTCGCCGPDFSIEESPTLEEATGYERGCTWSNGSYIDEPGGRHGKKYLTLEEYVASDTVLVIYANGVEQ
jgi:hypothetical protein